MLTLLRLPLSPACASLRRDFASHVPKTQRPLSPYAADAVALLGQLIRKARIERKLKAIDVADRAGVSRGLLRRIETGDPGCTMGAVFEVAAIVGVRLFDIDQTALSKAVQSNREIMTLLPKSVRGPRIEADDDF